MATGAPANCKPFAKVPQMQAPTTVPNKIPCPPRVLTPPITAAAKIGSVGVKQAATARDDKKLSGGMSA